MNTFESIAAFSQVTITLYAWLALAYAAFRFVLRYYPLLTPVQIDGGLYTVMGMATATVVALHPKPIAFRKEAKEKNDDKDIEVHVEVVLQYNDSYNDQVLCYTNTVHNPDGGSHLSGFRSRSYGDNADAEKAKTGNTQQFVKTP